MIYRWGGSVEAGRPVILGDWQERLRSDPFIATLRASAGMSRRYHDCIHFIADLELELYGKVMSESIQDHVATCPYDPGLISVMYR